MQCCFTKKPSSLQQPLTAGLSLSWLAKKGRLSLFPGSLTLVFIICFFISSSSLFFEVLLFIFSILILFLFIYCLHHVACRFLVPLPRIEPVSPAMQVQSLNH